MKNRWLLIYLHDQGSILLLKYLHEQALCHHTEKKNTLNKFFLNDEK